MRSTTGRHSELPFVSEQTGKLHFGQIASVGLTLPIPYKGLQQIVT